MITNTQTTLRFTALDTWFFRESRPMESLGGSELASVFPPPPRTLLGALRTAIGDAMKVDWHEYQPGGKDHKRLAPHIGYADDLGPLSLSGPWLSLKGERLYPVPRCLLTKGTQLTHLVIGEPVETYLGRVCLPQMPEGKVGYRALEQTWITHAGLERVLSGQTPDPTELCHATDLYQEEPRLGIARDNGRRTAQDGMLYQTRHLRPKAHLAVEIDLTHDAATVIPGGPLRLGGEGRLAHLEALSPPPVGEGPGEREGRPITPGGSQGLNVPSTAQGLLLVLLTPACFTGSSPWRLPGFREKKLGEQQVWTGEIAGIPLILHSAILGKAQREGGWDMVNHRPRPVQSLVPAGSCYYLSTEHDLADAIKRLHGARIGGDQVLGRGHLACGVWP